MSLCMVVVIQYNASFLQISLNMWARAVWTEEGVEFDGTVPLCWIEGETVRWPNEKSQVNRLFKAKAKFETQWLTFPLLKIKLTSGKAYKFCCHVFKVLTLLIFQHIVIYRFFGAERV